MKTFIALIIAGLAITVIAGVRQKSEAQYAKDEFVTDLIYRGRSKEEALWAASQMTADTLALFMNLPDKFPWNDSVGIFRKDGRQQRLSDDGKKGWIVVLRSKEKREVASNGYEPIRYFFEIESILVFDLTKGQKK
jgi:hypothetical protein